MALDLKISKKSVSSDCSTLTAQDSTGNYDVVTNPTGYGAPNAARASLYLKLLVTLKKTDFDTVITVPAVTEVSVTEWAITISEDGRYELFLFASELYAGGTTYELNYIVYDLVTDKFYYSVQNTNVGNAVTDTDWWLEATTTDHFLAAVNSAQTGTHNDIENIIELCNSTICKNNAILEELDCKECDSECVVKDTDRLQNHINGAVIQEAAKAYGKAQEIVETLQNLCEEISCQDC